MTVLAEEHANAEQTAELLRGIFHDLGLALMDWQDPPARPIARLENYLPKGESCSDSF